MPKHCPTLGLYLLPILIHTNATAATVFRCEDQQGRVTFTLQGCPQEQSQQLQTADNPTPGTGKPVPMATTRQAQRSDKEKAAKEIVVVAEHQDGCGNQLSASARRKAIVQQQMRSGMTKADVESALGRPDKVNSQNGQTRYQYNDRNGRTRSVTFDENGCVSSKRGTNRK